LLIVAVDDGGLCQLLLEVLDLLLQLVDGLLKLLTALFQRTADGGQDEGRFAIEGCRETPRCWACWVI
jgi:hypothetical protein